MEQAKKGGFMGIQKSHKGWCTPLSNPHCTGARRRLAITLKKHHGFHEDGGSIEAEYGLNYSPQGFMNVDPPIRRYDFSNLPLQSSPINPVDYNTNFNTSNIPLPQQGDINNSNLNYGYNKNTTQQGYLLPYLTGLNALAKGIANQKNISDSEHQRQFTDFDNQQPEETYFNQAYRRGTYSNGGYIPRYSIGGVILDNALPNVEPLDFNTPRQQETYINQTDPILSQEENTQSNDLVSLFKQGIVGPETGKKNYIAQNKNSTAYGAYQFLKGTRLGIYEKYLKDHFSSPQEFEQNYKNNPDVQEEVMDLHSKDLLSKFHGNMYAAAIAHFAGNNAAEKYLSGNLDLNKSPTPKNNSTYRDYLTKFSKSAGLPAKFKKGGVVEMDINESQIEKLRALGFEVNI